MSQHSLTLLANTIAKCTRCPELRDYCSEVAKTKRRAFIDQTYWGRPVPGFGDHRAKIMIVGLAPAAHGGNRTGRVFTGDRSGDFLYAALHRAGLANQPTSISRDDGLRLHGVYITAAARCAPPANKPTPQQLENCRPYLIEEIQTLEPRAIVCLGSIAWNAVLAAIAACGFALPKPRPKFAHGTEVSIGNTTILGCYHVSQQNTFTGRLTPRMLDTVLARARAIAAENQPLHSKAGHR